MVLKGSRVFEPVDRKRSRKRKLAEALSITAPIVLESSHTIGLNITALLVLESGHASGLSITALQRLRIGAQAQEKRL